MLYSSTILARNPSCILSRLSRLPAELGAHPLLFALSSNAPTSSLSSLVSALSALSASGSVGCLSAAAHPGAPIACSLAFFRKGLATPFYSNIPGRPETQVGRWHAMRKKGEETDKGQGIELALEEENVDWERIWSRSLTGDALPSSLRGLRCGSPQLCSSNSASREFDPDRRTCTRSSLSQTTLLRVSTRRCHHFPMQLKLVTFANAILLDTDIRTEARPRRFFYALRHGASLHTHFQWLRKILRRCWSRALCWSPSGPSYGFPRPTSHIRTTHGNLVRPPALHH